MATTKKATKKATTAKKPATKKAASKPAKTTVKRVTSTTRKVSAKENDTKLPANLVNIIIAEIVGTFVLTLVALFATDTLPLYVGLTLVVSVLTIGVISGSHINPAVTFGLWSMRKLKTVLVPFYWAAQLLGAMAAIVLLGAMSNGAFAVHFGHFASFSWGIFAAEMIGAAVFLFGVAAVINRVDIKATGRALGIGLSLMIGLVVAGSLLAFSRDAAIMKYQEEQVAAAESEEKAEEKAEERAYPREIYVDGPTLNPAVAMAVTEKTDSQFQQGGPTAQKGEKAYSRLTLEVIFGTLVGAAIGGNLFLLVNYRNRSEA